MSESFDFEDGFEATVRQVVAHLKNTGLSDSEIRDKLLNAVNDAGAAIKVGDLVIFEWKPEFGVVGFHGGSRALVPVTPQEAREVFQKYWIAAVEHVMRITCDAQHRFRKSR